MINEVGLSFPCQAVSSRSARIKVREAGGHLSLHNLLSCKSILYLCGKYTWQTSDTIKTWQQLQQHLKCILPEKGAIFGTMFSEQKLFQPTGQGTNDREVVATCNANEPPCARCQKVKHFSRIPRRHDVTSFFFPNPHPSLRFVIISFFRFSVLSTCKFDCLLSCRM